MGACTKGVVLSAYLTAGIKFPPRPTAGRPDKELMALWEQVIEELMGRGLESVTEMERVTGLGYSTCRKYMDIVQAKWSETMSREEQQWRREKLFKEADRVARAAWEEALACDHPGQKASLLKVVLAANQRKSALCGLDQIEINVNSKIETKTTIDVVSQVEEELQLQPGALENLGRQAALLFSKKREPEVIEGEVVGGN